MEQNGFIDEGGVVYLVFLTVIGMPHILIAVLQTRLVMLFIVVAICVVIALISIRLLYRYFYLKQGYPSATSFSFLILVIALELTLIIWATELQQAYAFVAAFLLLVASFVLDLASEKRKDKELADVLITLQLDNVTRSIIESAILKKGE